MAVNLSIKGVPEAIAARLRASAERHHRSLQGELMAIIERAVSAVDDGAEVEPVPPRTDPGAARRGTKTIEQIAAEHRVRFPHPIRREPLAVAILRADRDGR